MCFSTIIRRGVNIEIYSKASDFRGFSREQLIISVHFLEASIHNEFQRKVSYCIFQIDSKQSHVGRNVDGRAWQLIDPQITDRRNDKFTPVEKQKRFWYKNKTTL